MEDEIRFLETFIGNSVQFENKQRFGNNFLEMIGSSSMSNMGCVKQVRVLLFAALARAESDSVLG